MNIPRRNATPETPVAEPEKKRVRCAIYTRKSTTEGLQQDFNTLDAQRESGIPPVQWTVSLCCE